MLNMLTYFVPSGTNIYPDIVSICRHPKLRRYAYIIKFENHAAFLVGYGWSTAFLLRNFQFIQQALIRHNTSV